MLSKLQTPWVLNHSRSQHTHRDEDWGVWTPPGQCTEGQENKNKNRNQSLGNGGAGRERGAQEADGKKSSYEMKTVVKKDITDHVSRVLRGKRLRVFNTSE